ncbi:MAG TPA: rhodanese-like domain-containing protein [Verrucomicrobiae bacterium]|nr:rhodanese-like domain-containing protein [Verrucomicrobiae bacterium]
MTNPFLIALALLVATTACGNSAPIIPTEEARHHLTNGAVLIDVRTIDEYNAKHLTNAIHIPLDTLKFKLPAQVPDRSQALLLHCRTGRRSGIAETELRAMGYTNVFNVGSLEQAEKASGTKAQSGQPGSKN